MLRKRNHATIYTVDPTTEESDAKLMGALRELKPMLKNVQKCSISRDKF